MSLRQLPRKHLFSPFTRTARTTLPRRFQSSTPPKLPESPPSSLEGHARSQARVAKVLDRIPRPLRKYTDGLRNAPFSHIVSFLILHELTAIIPIFGMTAVFHWSGWLPPFVRPEAVSSLFEKMSKLLRRYGLIEPNEEIELPTIPDPDSKEWIHLDEAGSGRESTAAANAGRLVLEVSTAYAITKLLVPVRVIVSVWATPWFARVFVGRFLGLFGRKGAKKVDIPK